MPILYQPGYLTRACVHHRDLSDCPRPRLSPACRTRAITVNAGPGDKPCGAMNRRGIVISPVLWTAAFQACPALAFLKPPPGFRAHTDRLDGYSFVIPNNWVLTTTAGNDVAYRDPIRVYENMFVNVSSPSSSKYTSVTDLGSPEEAGERVLRQLLTEFMSTRIGIKRQGEIVSAIERTGSDGKAYYDIQTRIRSYASRSQLAVSAAEREAAVELEWDRLLLTTLGVANKRLYECRLQSDFSVPEDKLVSDHFMENCINNPNFKSGIITTNSAAEHLSLVLGLTLSHVPGTSSDHSRVFSM